MLCRGVNRISGRRPNIAEAGNGAACIAEAGSCLFGESAMVSRQIGSLSSRSKGGRPMSPPLIVIVRTVPDCTDCIMKRFYLCLADAGDGEAETPSLIALSKPSKALSETGEDAAMSVTVGVEALEDAAMLADAERDVGRDS